MKGIHDMLVIFWSDFQVSDPDRQVEDIKSSWTVGGSGAGGGRENVCLCSLAGCLLYTSDAADE